MPETRPTLTPEAAAEVQRLLRRQRRWFWVAGTGIAVTVLGLICFGGPTRNATRSTSTGAPDRLEAGAVSSPTPLTTKDRGPEVDFTSFSLPLVRQRFAAACPNTEVIPLSRPKQTDNYLETSDCAGTFFIILYAPAPVSKDKGVIAWGVMGPGELGTGTRMHLFWNCAVKVRRGSSDEVVPLTLEAKEYGADGDWSRQEIPVLTAAQLSSGLGP
jgi:hypothetical protein